MIAGKPNSHLPHSMPYDKTDHKKSLILCSGYFSESPMISYLLLPHTGTEIRNWTSWVANEIEIRSTQGGIQRHKSFVDKQEVNIPEILLFFQFLSEKWGKCKSICIEFKQVLLTSSLFIFYCNNIRATISVFWLAENMSICQLIPNQCNFTGAKLV